MWIRHKTVETEVTLYYVAYPFTLNCSIILFEILQMFSKKSPFLKQRFDILNSGFFILKLIVILIFVSLIDETHERVQILLARLLIPRNSMQFCTIPHNSTQRNAILLKNEKVAPLKDYHILWLVKYQQPWLIYIFFFRYSSSLTTVVV